MEDNISKKIDYEGTNFLTLHGISSMCINENEFNSVLNEQLQSYFLINGRIKVTLYEQILLEHNIHTKYFQKSLLSWAFINPYKAPVFLSIKKLFKLVSKKTSKTVNLDGFFKLNHKTIILDKERGEKIERFTLHATKSSKIEYESEHGELLVAQLTPNFYCAINENHMNYDEFGLPHPSSTLSYDFGTTPCYRSYYLERDVIALLAKEGYQYKLIESDFSVTDGETIKKSKRENEFMKDKNEKLNKKTLTALHNLIGALYHEILKSDTRRISKKSDLIRRLKGHYPGIAGVGTDTVGKSLFNGIKSLNAEMELKATGTEEQKLSVKSLIKNNNAF